MSHSGGKILLNRVIEDIRAAFGQTLLALKIYSTRYVHYRFSALIASARTQPRFCITKLKHKLQVKYMLINV